ncbi:MAG TPA: hypothetical protein PKZ32_06735 [Candidatus Melainabacteria bacterium]|nr:hypothetical protein [Candidatus Melainabacteria bacterium]
MKKEKHSLPLWSKSLIALVFIGVAGFLYTATSIILEFRTISLRSTDKAYMQVCAQKIARFPQPLPAGYEYTYDLDFDWFNVALLVVEHVSDKQKIYFICHLNDSSEAIAAKELLDRFYDIGITTESATCKFTDVKTKGELEVGSEKMLYMTGLLKDANGRVYEGLVGCIRNTQKKKTLLVWSLSEPGKALNMEVCTNLLKSLPSL